MRQYNKDAIIADISRSCDIYELIGHLSATYDFYGP